MNVVQLFSRPSKYKKERQLIERKWAEVQTLLAMKNEHGYKLAVLEADKLLDVALKTLQYPGENLGQRLKVAVARRPDLRPVWQAHILRNKIAHDTHIVVKRGQTMQAIKQFRIALKKLGFLK
jgi:hypothetical protein